MTLRRSAFLSGLAVAAAGTPARAAGFARALIVAVRADECDALEDACRSTPSVPFVARYQHTTAIHGRRGLFESANGTVEIWCVDDLLPSGTGARDAAVRARVTASIVGGNGIALVGAFGTAAGVTSPSQNGNVIIGTNTFARGLVTSALDDATFRNVIGSAAERTVAQPLLLSPPLVPATRPVVIADRIFVAVDDSGGEIAALRAYRRSGATAPVGSLDATPALIRAHTSAPFFFVSGITHRVGTYEREVAPRAAAQTFAAAYNAGIAVAAMVTRMLYFLAR